MPAWPTMLTDRLTLKAARRTAPLLGCLVAALCLSASWAQDIVTDPSGFPLPTVNYPARDSVLGFANRAQAGEGLGVPSEQPRFAAPSPAYRYHDNGVGVVWGLDRPFHHGEMEAGETPRARIGFGFPTIGSARFRAGSLAHARTLDLGRNSVPIRSANLSNASSRYIFSPSPVPGASHRSR